MLKISIGRIKTCILIVLIFSSLILSENLWFEDYHGFSTIFTDIGDMTSKLFGTGIFDIQKKCEQVIIPYKIIINNGEKGHWILYSTDEKNKKFWKITKNLLKDIGYASNDKKTNYVQKSEWDNLLKKRSIIIDFQYPLRQEIISLLFDIETKKISQTVINISQMGITKLGENLIFYTKSTKNNKDVYAKYYFSNQTLIDDKDFEEIFIDTTLIKYASLKEAFANIKTNLTYENQVFGPIFSFSSSRKDSIMLKEVKFGSEITTSNNEQIYKLVDKFFEGKDYAKFIKNDGTYIFIDEKNNTFKIYSDGFIQMEIAEYDVIKKESINFKDALKTALIITEKFGGINTLYLTGFDINNGQYTFKFNYAINGIPVMCSRQQKSPEMNNAVEVKIGNGLIKIKRFVYNYKILGKEHKLYSDYDSIINTVFEEINFNEQTKINIENIMLVYKVTGQNEMVKLPVWVVKYKINGEEILTEVSAIKNRR